MSEYVFLLFARVAVCVCVWAGVLSAKLKILLGCEVRRSLPMQAASREEVIDG